MNKPQKVERLCSSGVFMISFNEQMENFRLRDLKAIAKNNCYWGFSNGNFRMLTLF